MNIEDIKVGGFYLGIYNDCIDYVTKIIDNMVHYEVYWLDTGLKTGLTCDNRYYTRLTRPISPAEIFLRYGNIPEVVGWVKNLQEKGGSWIR